MSQNGTTILTRYIPVNQKVYLQSRSQWPGVRFPFARLVALFGLASGARWLMAVRRCRGKGQVSRR
jgi:hypothetical protein